MARIRDIDLCYVETRVGARAVGDIWQNKGWVEEAHVGIIRDCEVDEW